MVSIQLSEKPILSSKTQSIAYLLRQDFSMPHSLLEIAQNAFPALATYIKQMHFAGKTGDALAIPIAHGDTIFTLFLLGLGKESDKKTIEIESYRRALGSLIKMMQQRKMDSVALRLPNNTFFGVDVAYLAEQTAIVSSMASYRFDDFISNKDRKVNQNLSMELVIDPAQRADIERGLKRGKTIVESVNKVRHWIDLPAKYLTPLELADKASQIADRFGLKATIFGEQEVITLGMGGLAAVSAGSEVDCRFVILEYTAPEKSAPTIAFVGKGITFDSGGLSIKPAAAMETMKEDMSGAAAVIGAMEVLAQLKPNVNIVAITPLSENMPSGKATKPGDIIRFYNGKTAEVRNTDAEGRLILADALSYAVKHYKLDAMIDLATLTGACAYALGPYFSGMMSQHDELVARLEDAAKRSGDRVWRLPFDNDYKSAIKSEVADICNIGSQTIKAGAITAGFFLQNFVDDVPWVHLDIAGVAYDVPNISYLGVGATGYGVRLLVELAMNWK